MRVFPYQDGDQLIELVEKRELDAAKAMIELIEDALIEIEASLYEDESENAAADASWHLARKALKKLNEHNK